MLKQWANEGSRQERAPIIQSTCSSVHPAPYSKISVSGTGHSNSASTLQAQVKGNWYLVHSNNLGCQQSKGTFLCEHLYYSVQTSPVVLSIAGIVGRQVVWLQSLWSQLSQWLTGRVTTGLHLCFLRSKNNFLHLPLNSDQTVKYKYTGHIPTSQNGTALRVSGRWTDMHILSCHNSGLFLFLFAQHISTKT